MNIPAEYCYNPSHCHPDGYNPFSLSPTAHNKTAKDPQVIPHLQNTLVSCPTPHLSISDIDTEINITKAATANFPDQPVLAPHLEL